MDLCQQAADAIAGLRNLACQILVKPAQHRELCNLVVGQLQRAKGMGQAAGGLGDDVGIPRVGLGFSGVQVGDASHRQPRQVRYQHAFCTGHRNRKCSHRGGLIHDKQDLAVFFELSDQRSQFRLVVGQGTVQKTFTLAIQCDGMMRSLADVDTDEDLDAVMLLNVSHACS